MVTLSPNVGLDDAATSQQTGTVGEPSVAVSGKRMMITGNWYASRSTDGGRTWTFIDPFTEFPGDVGEFCCDQLIHYSSKSRLWVWLLQYSVRGTSNAVRIATSRTGAPGSWTWWDIRPADIDPSWTSVWFDYPDLAESHDHLYISTNVYNTSDEWVAAAVIRYPMADIAAKRPLTRRSWTTKRYGSMRFVQGAGDTMWFAAHPGGERSLRVFAWPDDETGVHGWTVPIGDWTEGTYHSVGPGGAEWLARLDGRITGGFRSGGLLGFAWTASPRPGRPNPYIRVVRIDEATLKVHDEPDLWSAAGSWAYPATAPNRRGAIGMTAFFGGPTHPAHAVGAFDEPTGTWSMTITATSTNGPSQGKWGDYLVCRAHSGRPTSWVASGFTLQGGTDRRNIEPRIVVFRR